MSYVDIDGHTIYTGAAKMLIDRIHEVNHLLSKSELKSGRTESWLFWKKTSDVMKYAWDYMRSLDWILQQNVQLRQENQYLRARNQHLEQINLSIVILRRAKLQGNFEETVAFVDDLMEWGVEKLENALNELHK